MGLKYRKAHCGHSGHIDLKPMMNLFTVLVPFLLVCASWASIRIINVQLPSFSHLHPVGHPADSFLKKPLLLTIFITDEGLRLGARGAMLPTTFTREFHKYVYSYPGGSGHKETHMERITPENRKELPLCPQDKSRQLTLYEREEIILYAIEKESEDDTGKVMDAVYNKFDEPMTEVTGKMFDHLPEIGDTLYVLSLINRRMEIVKDPAEYTVRELTVYDQLASRLLRIKAKYPDVPDQGEIKLVAEDDVVFDKIIHIMDVCREFGYPKISLAKLAG